MALKSTVYKAEVQIADMNRHYYETHQLTLALHPSETEERLMMRLLAFARYADENLSFGRGLSTDDEPDLWLKDLTGAIQLWIDVGQPDEKLIRRACGRADQVVVLSYAHSADIWWEQNRGKLERLGNLGVLFVPASVKAGLASMAKRTMQLQCTIQDSLMWIADGNESVQIELEVWKPEITD